MGDYRRQREPIPTDIEDLATQFDETGLCLSTCSRLSSVESTPPALEQMNLRSATYHTAAEVKASILDSKDRIEDENDVTTNTDNDSEPEFDTSDDDEFDPIQGGDYDAIDDNIDIDEV